MKAAGPDAEIPATLYELEQRIGPLTSEALDLVTYELAQRWRALDGFERHVNTGSRGRQTWFDSFPGRTDPSWTPEDRTRIRNSLDVKQREAAAFARLLKLLSEVAAEPTHSESTGQSVLDAAWRRLDAEKIRLESSRSPSGNQPEERLSGSLIARAGDGHV